MKFGFQDSRIRKSQNRAVESNYSEVNRATDLQVENSRLVNKTETNSFDPITPYRQHVVSPTNSKQNQPIFCRLDLYSNMDIKQ